VPVAVSVALVNAKSTIDSVQLVLGQAKSGLDGGIGDVGGDVVTLNGRLPFVPWPSGRAV
jgi:hypothetical protein